MRNGPNEFVIRLDHVSTCFNMSCEKVDSIKEYLIKMVCVHYEQQ